MWGSVKPDLNGEARYVLKSSAIKVMSKFSVFIELMENKLADNETQLKNAIDDTLAQLFKYHNTAHKGSEI